MKVTASAPGKLMLLGDHAVIYNHPCLVTAVNQRIKATIYLNTSQEFFLDAPDVKVKGYKKLIREVGKGDIPKGAQFAEIAVKNVLQKYSLNKGVTISTSSEFSSMFGFGSSSASTVCIVKALSELFNIKLSKKEIFDISYKTVLDIQGKGSGFDIAAATYGGTLYFVTGGRIIQPLSVKFIPLVVGYSGIKADTVTLINSVRDRFKNNQKRLDTIYSEIETLVEKAKKSFAPEDWEIFGKCMNKNQTFLQELGVSIPKLDIMIDSALKRGAYGAKLSGAGGGDCMIALYPTQGKQTIEKAIESVGGKIIQVSTNAEGVKIENE